MATLRYTEISQQQHPAALCRFSSHAPTRQLRQQKERAIALLCCQTYTELRQQAELPPTGDTQPIFKENQLYWAVEETASRIAQTAIKIARHNIDNWAIIRNAVEKGFNDAKLAFGGTLPRQAEQIHNAVFFLLDRWASNWMATTSMNRISGE